MQIEAPTWKKCFQKMQYRHKIADRLQGECQPIGNGCTCYEADQTADWGRIRFGKLGQKFA